MSTTDTDRLRESFTYTDGDVTYPFFEDEYCNITGYGHQDKAEFAAAVTRFGIAVVGVDPEDAHWDESHVAHHWVLIDEDEERLWVRLDRGKGEPVTESTPGAVPVTSMWGQR